MAVTLETIKEPPKLIFLACKSLILRSRKCQNWSSFTASMLTQLNYNQICKFVVFNPENSFSTSIIIAFFKRNR